MAAELTLHRDSSSVASQTPQKYSLTAPGGYQRYGEVLVSHLKQGEEHLTEGRGRAFPLDLYPAKFRRDNRVDVGQFRLSDATLNYSGTGKFLKKLYSQNQPYSRKREIPEMTLHCGERRLPQARWTVSLTNSQKIGSSVDSGRADGSRRVIGHLAEREISSGGDRIKNIGRQGDKGSTLVEGYKKVAPGTGVWHELCV